MKTTLIKLGSVIGGFFLLIAGILVVYFKGKSEGKEETESKQRKATLKRIDESRKLQDEVYSMNEKELHEKWEKNKLLQGEDEE